MQRSVACNEGQSFVDERGMGDLTRAAPTEDGRQSLRCRGAPPLELLIDFFFHSRTSTINGVLVCIPTN